jgi:hypothetical protein
VCAWVGNQRSRGVVTVRVRTDVVQRLMCGQNRTNSGRPERCWRAPVVRSVSTVEWR